MSFFVSGQLPHQRAAFNGPVPVAGTALVLPTSFSGQGAAAVRLANGRFLETTGTTTAGIQEAMNYLGNGGGTILLSAGEYKITTTILRPGGSGGAPYGGKIAIIGDASFTSRIIMTTPVATPMIQFDSTAGTGSESYGNITIQNVKFRQEATSGSGGHCLTFDDVFHVDITNCSFEGAPVGQALGRGDGIHFEGTCEDVRVINNNFGSGLNYGVYVISSAQVLIEGNTVHENFAEGIYVITSKGVIVSGNTSASNHGSGIVVADIDTYSNNLDQSILVQGNICYNNGAVLQDADEPQTKHGINATGSRGVNVTGNFCERNWGNGILLRNCSRAVISSNSCHGNGLKEADANRDGIQLYAGSGEDQRYCSIIGNVCGDKIVLGGENPKVSLTQGRGIHEKTGGGGEMGLCTIIGNVCLDEDHVYDGLEVTDNDRGEGTYVVRLDSEQHGKLNVDGPLWTAP